MHILFLSVTAGQGHNQTAKGIMQRMMERGHVCKLLDTFDYIEPTFGEVVDKGIPHDGGRTRPRCSARPSA